MAITVDPNVSSAPPPPLDLNFVHGTPLEGTEDAADKNRTERQGEKQKLARAEEQRLETQDRPPPKPPTSKPTRQAEVAKPAEPSPQPDASKDKDPQAAEKARKVAESAGDASREQADVYQEKIVQSKTAVAPAIPEAPAKPVELGQSETKNGGKDGDPKGVADAKTDSGKPSDLTKADAKMAGKEKEQLGKSSTGHEVASKDEGGPKTKSYEGLLSGRQEKPETKLSAGDKKLTAIMVTPSAGVVKGTAPQPAKSEGFFAKLATAWQKALGKPLPMPTAPKHTPALAKGGKPESGNPQASLSQSTPVKTHQPVTVKSSDTPSVPEGQKGPENLVKTFLTSESPHDVETREQLLAQVLLYGKNILRGGQPLPTAVNAAAAQVAFQERVKGKNGSLDKMADGEKEVAGKEGDSGKEANLKRSYLVNRHRDRRSA